MKWSSVLLVTILALVAAVGVINCGQSNHGPGSDGMVDTGARLQVTSLQSFDGSKQTMDISMTPGTTASPQFDANFTVTLDNVAPYPDGTATTGITVESYQVEYISSAPGSVPIPTMKNVGMGVHIDPNGSATLSGLVLLSAGAKYQWMADGGDAFLDPPYQMVITFFGVNDFGYEISATGQVGVLLGAYARQ